MIITYNICLHGNICACNTGRNTDMAIFLRDLYYDTKRKYNLNLISGGKGMENIVSWVYISEDISTSTFLNGGEPADSF